MAILNWLRSVPWSDGAVVAAWIAFAASILAASTTFVYRKIAESKSVNNAVGAESQRLLAVLRAHEKWWAERIRVDDTNQPLIPFSHVVYIGQVKRIGALGPRKVAMIVRFYGYVDFINAFQSMHGRYKDMNKSAEFNLRYHQLLLNCITSAKIKSGEAWENIEDFVADYRLKLCNLKMALASHNSIPSTDTQVHVLRMAEEVIAAVKTPGTPPGFGVLARDDFARLERAITAKSTVDVQSASDSLYQDAAVNLSYRVSDAYSAARVEHNEPQLASVGKKPQS